MIPFKNVQSQCNIKRETDLFQGQDYNYVHVTVSTGGRIVVFILIANKTN